MSANIYWEPSKRPFKNVPALAPQSFMESLHAAGIDCPGIVGESALPALRGMAKMHGPLKDGNPYFVLIEAIEKHDEIELSVCY